MKQTNDWEQADRMNWIVDFRNNMVTYGERSDWCFAIRKIYVIKQGGQQMTLECCEGEQ